MATDKLGEVSDAAARPGRLRRLFRLVPWGIVGPIVSLALFAGALVVLANILHEVKPEDVLDAFTATPMSALWLSILFTFLSYLSLTGYDGLALRQIGARDVPYSTAAIGSFTSYAISYTLGFPLLTAGAVRYRVYGAAGLSAPQIAALTLVCTLTFWLGMATVLAAGLLLVPQAVASVDHLPDRFNFLIGLCLIAVVAGYVVFVSTRRRVVRVEGWSLPLPGGRVTGAQILLGVFDVCMGAAALFVLLPSGAQVDFWSFTVIYVLAAILGVVSHAPGGIGVFEATIMLALPTVPLEALLGSLLLFRVVYYFIPFALALAILAAYEIARRRQFLLKAVDKAADTMKPVAPILVGGAVFVAGAGVILTGVLPIGGARRALMEGLVPLPVIEIAHVALAMLGTVLMFLARGLIRRLRDAWLAAAISLTVVAVLAFPRGADWRLALAVVALLGVLLLARPAFGRRARLLSARFSFRWVGAIASVIAGSIWLGIFTYRLNQGASFDWSTLGLHADDARFVRATIASILTTIVIVAVSAIRRRRAPLSVRPGALAAETLVRADPRPAAGLALLDDKTLLANPAQTTVLPFARKGQSLVALGDPIGDPACATELIWLLREKAEAIGRQPALLGITPALRGACLEAGLALTPIGAEALADLSTATPAQPEDQALAGLGLTLDPPGADPAVALDLARAWRMAEAGDDAGFVVGPASADWFRRHARAVLKHEGAIAAVAVIPQGAGGHRWAIDRVALDPVLAARFGPEVLLDALVSKLAVLGRIAGAKELSLGLVPDPMRADPSLEPTWQRVSPRLYGLGAILADPGTLRAFAERHARRFEPRYLACVGGWAMPAVLLDITAMIEEGPDLAGPPQVSPPSSR